MDHRPTQNDDAAATCRPQFPGPGALPGAVPGVLFPDLYVWLLLVSALDGMCTWMILTLGGVEVNPIADAVLGRYGFAGMVVFKFALIALVIVLCEHIGRPRPRAAKAVVSFGIGVTCVPVLWALLQIAASS